MLELELQFLKFLQESLGNGLASLFKLISMIGEGPVGFVVIALLYFIINKDWGLYMLYVFGGSHVFNGTIKNFVKRPRPWVTDPTIQCSYGNTATGYSFPSGHSQTIATESGFVIQKSKKAWPKIVAIVVALLVGFSRLAVRAHYPSDVIVGLILGFACGIFGTILIEKVGTKKTFLYTILVFLPFAILFLFLDDKDPSTAQFADFYKTYGILICGYLGILFENKYVNFKIEGSLGRRIARFAVAAGVVGILYLGLSALFNLIGGVDFVKCLLGFVKYGLLAFVLIGVMPLLLKKLKDRLLILCY